MKYNLFPSLYAISLYEKMSGHSFLKLKENPDDILPLMYCCLIAHPENGVHDTYNTVVSNFISKHLSELIVDFETETKLLDQFVSKAEKSEDKETVDSSVDASPEEKEPMPLSKVIPILIMDCGLTPDFVLHELHYSMIDDYIQNYISRKRSQMEESRFWTWLTVLPHVDGKKIDSPEKLIPFSWETDEKSVKIKEQMNIDRARLIQLGIIKEETETEPNQEDS